MTAAAMFDMQRWRRHAIDRRKTHRTLYAARVQDLRRKLWKQCCRQTMRQAGRLVDVPSVDVRPVFDPRSSQATRHSRCSRIDQLLRVSPAPHAFLKRAQLPATVNHIITHHKNTRRQNHVRQTPMLQNPTTKPYFRRLFTLQLRVPV